MNTEELIRLLAQDTAPANRRRLTLRTGIALAVGVLLSLIGLHEVLGVRADLGTAVVAVAFKAGFCACLSVAAISALRPLARPGASAQRLLMPAGVILVGLTVAVALVMSAPAGQRWWTLTQGQFPSCLIGIPVLAVPIAAALTWAWRDAAPTRLTLAGAGVGTAAGALAAVVFSLHCPVDAVAYVGFWYGSAVGISAALGALAGHRLFRW